LLREAGGADGGGDLAKNLQNHTGIFQNGGDAFGRR